MSNYNHNPYDTNIHSNYHSENNPNSHSMDGTTSDFNMTNNNNHHHRNVTATSSTTADADAASTPTTYEHNPHNAVATIAQLPPPKNRPSSPPQQQQQQQQQQRMYSHATNTDIHTHNTSTGIMNHPTYNTTTNNSNNSNYIHNNNNNNNNNNVMNQSNYYHNHEQQQGYTQHVVPTSIPSMQYGNQYEYNTNTNTNMMMNQQMYTQQQHLPYSPQQLPYSPQQLPYSPQQYPQQQQQYPYIQSSLQQSPYLPNNYHNNNNIGVNNTNGNISYNKRKVTLKLIVLGNSGVGKTSLMHRYVKNQYTGQYKATIGADFLPKQITIPTSNNNTTFQNVTLQIWDTAGQERFQSLGNSFYRGADACVLVFDVFDRSSFDGLDKWKNDFLNVVSFKGAGGGNSSSMNSSMNSSRSCADFPFVVMGNKADKESTTSGDERQVFTEEGREWCRTMGNIPYFETSAKTGMNVEDAFLKIAKVAFEKAEKKRRTESPYSYGSGSGGMVYGNMRGYVPPHQTVDLNRNYQTHEHNSNDCCL